MRMAFGLVSVLVSIGILILLISMMLDQRPGSVMSTGIAAREEAKQIAGVGIDGEAATSSAAMQEITNSSGKLDNLLVTQVVPGGAYDTYYGLKKNDSITRINGMKVNDISMGDSSLAKSLVSDAFQRQQPITVVREGREITLPLPAAARPAAPAVAAGAPTTAPAPTAAKEDTRNPYRRQLDAIKGAVN